MTEVAKIIASAVFSSDNEEELKKLREKSLKLCKNIHYITSKNKE